MEPILAANLPAIRALCQRSGVRTLWVFGSAAEGEPPSRFNPNSSDYDFVVDFGDTDLGPWAHRLSQFREDLEALLGRHVDLVTLRALRERASFRDVDKRKVPLYAAA
jgi:predicted nucleotidyltransferase